MISWPLAVTLMFLGTLFILSQSVLSHRRFILRSKNEQSASNVQFLSAETEAKRLDRIAEREADWKKHESERRTNNRQASGLALYEMLNAMRVGHKPDCSYCDCGHSKAIKGTTVMLDHQRGLVDDLKKTMIDQGWTPPDLS